MDLQEHPDAWRFIIARVLPDGVVEFIPNVVAFSENGSLQRMVKQGDGSWVSVEESAIGCYAVEKLG